MKHIKLTKKMKKEWLVALRSGKYKQCKGQLHNGEGFCCLGVLLDACVLGYWVAATNKELELASDGLATRDKEHWAYVYEGTRSPPITEVPKDFLVQLADNDMTTLMTMNDNGSSFKTIANYIETEIKPSIG